MLLALDTATQLLSIALYDGYTIVAEHTHRPAASHTIEAAPAVADLLARTGTPRSALSAVAVARGPGTYSGLRVGVSLAKGLATALGVPLVGIDTLAITAAGCPPPAVPLSAAVPLLAATQLPAATPLLAAVPLLVFMAAGRGRITVQRFAWQSASGAWHAQDAPTNESWAGLIARIVGASAGQGEAAQPGDSEGFANVEQAGDEGAATAGGAASGAVPLLCGEIDAEGRAALAEAEAAGARFTRVSPVFAVRRAGTLAVLAWDALAAAEAEARAGGDPVKTRFHPAVLVPVYAASSTIPPQGG